MVLYTLFLYASCAGIDRAGGPHRLTACTMYRRLKMGCEFPPWINDMGSAKKTRICKALSRTAWGLFCLESISSFVYIQPALISPPTLPRIFDGNREDTAPDDPNCPDPYLDAECSVSVLLFDIMSYNHEDRYEVGSPEDISARMSYYQRLMGWVSPPRGVKGRGLTGLAQSIFLQYVVLPSNPRNSNPGTRLTCNHHRAYFLIAVIALFRPLATLDISLPNGLGSSSTFCVQHCKRMNERMQEFGHAYPEDCAKGCVGTLYFFYVVSISLVALLDKEPDSHPLFVDACRHFHHVSNSFGVGRALLRGLQAMALEMQAHLPEQSLSYFAQASIKNEHFKDVPVSYVIPQNKPTRGSPGSDGADESSSEVQLGNLIEKWSAVSLQE